MPTAVLIVNYRTYPELAVCLTSLRPHLLPDDEVVVVDYESDSHALAAAVAPFSRASGGQAIRLVTIPRTDNLGFAAGVNRAAAASTARFLLLLNPDTIVLEPVARVLEQWMTGHPGAGVAGARVRNADGTVQASARRFPGLTAWLGGRSTWLTSRFPGNWFSQWNLVGLDAKEPIEVDWVSGACLMTRRDVFDRVGGFDDKFFLYWEDADYCSRVAEAGLRCMYVPTAGVTHAAGRASRHNQAAAIAAFHRSAFRLYWKRASPIGRLAAPLVKAALWSRAQYHIRRRETNP